MTFEAQQTGSTVNGTAISYGPLVGYSIQLTGTVTNEGVTLAFNAPPGPTENPPPPQESAVAWTYRGEFSSATTITGTVVSSTGITGQMVITQDNSVPVQRSRPLPR